MKIILLANWIANEVDRQVFLSLNYFRLELSFQKLLNSGNFKADAAQDFAHSFPGVGSEEN